MSKNQIYFFKSRFVSNDGVRIACAEIIPIELGGVEVGELKIHYDRLSNPELASILKCMVELFFGRGGSTLIVAGGCPVPEGVGASGRWRWHPAEDWPETLAGPDGPRGGPRFEAGYWRLDKSRTPRAPEGVIEGSGEVVPDLWAMAERELSGGEE